MNSGHSSLSQFELELTRTSNQSGRIIAFYLIKQINQILSSNFSTLMEPDFVSSNFFGLINLFSKGLFGQQ